MRRFLVLGHTQRSQPPFPLNDPSGAGGRWDVLARCVTHALLVSHGVRADSEIQLLLLQGTPPRRVRAVGKEIRSLNPDERSTVALLSKALETQDVGSHESTPLPGIHVAHRTLAQALEDARQNGPVIALREDAAESLDRFAAAPLENATFVLSDHREPTTEEAALVRSMASSAVNLGPVSLQADHCIVVVHNHLDRHVARGPRPN